MAKRLKQDAITKADLTKFLETESDFAFELSAIPILQNSGWQVEHGGTYSDPVTGVNRQFDLRAHYLHTPPNPVNNRPWFSVSTNLAIECKNLRPNFPLLISSVKREEAEGYLSLVVSNGLGRFDVRKLSCATSGYRVGGSVGKATDQVGITDQGAFANGDSEVYEKWSQAIASSADLLKAATMGDPGPNADVAIGMVLPVLLVPDGTLWECRYDGGELVAAPAPTDHVEFYIGKEWEIPWPPKSFRISHLEILTYSGFRSWAREAPRFDANSVFGMACFELAQNF